MPQCSVHDRKDIWQLCQRHDIFTFNSEHTRTALVATADTVTSFKDGGHWPITAAGSLPTVGLDTLCATVCDGSGNMKLFASQFVCEDTWMFRSISNSLLKPSGQQPADPMFKRCVQHQNSCAQHNRGANQESERLFLVSFFCLFVDQYASLFFNVETPVMKTNLTKPSQERASIEVYVLK